MTSCPYQYNCWGGVTYLHSVSLLLRRHMVEKLFSKMLNPKHPVTLRQPTECYPYLALIVGRLRAILAVVNGFSQTLRRNLVVKIQPSRVLYHSWVSSTENKIKIIFSYVFTTKCNTEISITTVSATECNIENNITIKSGLYTTTRKSGKLRCRLQNLTQKSV